MRTGTVSYRLEDLKNGVIIPIGFVGENDFTKVFFDAEEIYKKYPSASVSMKVQPPKGVIYPATVTRDGNTVIWQVKEADVANRGGGELQLTFTDGETKIKTYIAKTDVKRSLAGNGPAPDPVQGWIDDADEKLAEVDDALADLAAMDNIAKTALEGDIGKALSPKTVENGVVTEWQFVEPGAGTDDYADLDNKPSIAGVTLSGNKTLEDLGIAADDDLDNLADEVSDVKTAIHGLAVTPEMFGAKGDGTTDDSQAMQDAVDTGYNIKLDDNKTYYLASPVTIDHDIHISGGENTVIKTKTPTGGTVNNAFVVDGTLKKTTTLTGDYNKSNTDNTCNKFTLSDMDGISIGDIIVIRAEDQYYSYARQYYYLGATFTVTDIYDGHIYTCDTMPWDIENTENVIVEIYDAPEVIVEGLRFESDIDSLSAYRYCLALQHCKNATIKDCTFNHMNCGLFINHCVNTLISNVRLSKSKYDNSLQGDGYGIAIYSSTNTIIERVLSTCGQHSITISGHEPSLNTFIRNCDLTSECRNPGLDTHECTYNLVIEDCVLGTAALNGTVTINRCKIINNKRAANSIMGITLFGSHDPDRARFKIFNTYFDNTWIIIPGHLCQSPIQSFDNIIGSIEIENCRGGKGISYIPAASQDILSNIIQLISIKNWQEFDEIYYDKTNALEKLIISDSTIKEPYIVNNHQLASTIDGIQYFDITSTIPLAHKLSVSRDTYGENLVLPKDTKIHVSSTNPSAKFIVCGDNLVSDDISDYFVGSVGGSAGGQLTRSVITGSNIPSIAFNNDGEIVYSQGDNTSKCSIYPLGLFYVKEPSAVTISAKIYDTGNASGTKFRAAIAVVDCKTGKLVDRYFGTEKTAAVDGVIVSHGRGMGGGFAVLAYFYCNNAVSGSETTFKEYSVKCTPIVGSQSPSSNFVANRRTGDGDINSVGGINNIMCSETLFNVKLMADLVNQ